MDGKWAGCGDRMKMMVWGEGMEREVSHIWMETGAINQAGELHKRTHGLTQPLFLLFLRVGLPRAIWRCQHLSLSAHYFDNPDLYFDNQQIIQWTERGTVRHH